MFKKVFIVLVFFAFAGSSCRKQEVKKQYNVVFIICDDLNTVVHHPKNKPGVHCPAIDKFREQAVTFTNAYANDPICAPSRSSMMTGIMPHHSNLTWFEPWYQNEILSNSVHMLEHFKNNGYKVFGAGKLYHNGEEPYDVYDEFGPKANFGPFPWKGKGGEMDEHPRMNHLFENFNIQHKWEQTFGSLSDMPAWEKDEKKGIPGYTGWRLFGKPFKYNSDTDRDLMPDELYANFAKKILNENHDSPFFLGIGFCRPHTPLYVPERYFDMFPLKSIQLPKVSEGDLNDCAKQLSDTSLYGFRRYQFLQQDGNKQLYKKWIQAYLASIAFVDEQVGKVLDAVQNSKYADNTIVIFTSDHGFQMGEKNFLYKQSAWSEACRIPLVISYPDNNTRRAICDQPVSLIDIYPTLIDACKLSENPNVNGKGDGLYGNSLLSLLKEPTGKKWKGKPYALTILPGEDHTSAENFSIKPSPHFTVSTREWRYIQTSGGEEELYHLKHDPLEWNNLAYKNNHKNTIQQFRDIVSIEKLQAERILAKSKFE